MWRACIILLCMLAAFLGASWCAIDWTGAGSDEYPGGVVLRDDAGNVLRVSLGEGDVDCRPYYSADADDWIVKALVASEDGTFWEHRGVRPLSVLRAAFQNVTCRRRVSGASTITMQAVRLIAPHPKTFWWKWKEAVMALKMERRRSKEWIVSQYLNRAPFGSNLVGIEAAAQGWLGKGAKDLGIGEAAMLAGMVQAPSRFRPDRHYDRALKRRDYVLERMLKLGMIDEGQFEGAKSVKPQIRRAPRPFRAPYFCDWVMGEMRGGFIETALPGYGRGGAAQDVRTTLNADIQAACENAVDAAARAGGYSVAAVVMEARSGDVKALACSGDYFDKADGQVNTAVAPRPAGSTLKPFLAALAIERGVISPDERLCDVPVAYKGYRPANFDGRHRGMVSVRDALVMSLNIPFVQMLRRTGVETFGDCLRELGFRHIGADESAGLGMAIGNVEVSL
ncbi:MAG: transglycosylase domain-containing protein, partial [Kiritimatiellae bacterium]|nr:transglycosylase domain-containing protein [Kiritimatiellia bacterium]